MNSTVVSFAKLPIHEEIPGMQRSLYEMPVSENGIPQLLHVGDSFYYKPDIDGNQDKVFVQSEQIVNSIVHMHITSQLLYRPDQCPAVFAIPNREVDEQLVLSEFKDEVKSALARQRRWFTALVQMADDDWGKLRKHQMISDVQRIAATELGLKREWLMDIQDESEKGSCPFCGSDLFDITAPICPVCHKVHNPERLAELEAKFKKVNPVTGR